MRTKVNWPFFIVGCVLLLAALAAFFWGFALGTLTASQRFLLLWLLPLASGFACGCFAGSLHVTGKIGTLATAATGGFAIWVLTFYGLPRAADMTELRDSLAARHSHGESIISGYRSNAGLTKEQMAGIDAFKVQYDHFYRDALEALDKGQMHRFYETTRQMIDYIQFNAPAGLLPDSMKQQLINVGTLPPGELEKMHPEKTDPIFKA